jgi:copper chaperone CopZ
MKQFLMIFSAVLLLSAPAKADIAEAADRDVLVTVNGMVCDFCAQSLKKVFGKEDGVTGLSVDLDNQLVIIDMEDGASISDEKIAELIDWGGYDLVSIERPDANE